MVASAGAAEIKLVGESAPTITITGYIDDHDGRRFAEIADANPWASVMLNSPGGHVVSAIQIGRKIRERKFSTLIGSKQVCASACGLIWLAGRERFVFTSAKVGFHASYTVNGSSLDVSSVGNALVGGYLRDLGYSDDVIVYASIAAPKNMQWLSADDADRLGITYKSLRDRLQTNTKPDASSDQEFYAPAHYTFVNGYMLVGSSILKPIKNISRVEDCTRQCDQTLDCVAINYDIRDKACHLKTEVVVAVKNKRYKSGYQAGMNVKVSDPLAITGDPSLHYLFKESK